MLVVETVAKIRRAHLSEGKGIKTIARELGLSRNTVRKVLRSGQTSFVYEREEQPRPRLGSFVQRLEAMLEANATASKRDRLTLTRIYDLLRREGYGGSYDAVRRYAGQWVQEKRGFALAGEAFVPLSFAPGDAYQFDWSHEQVELGGAPQKVKVAHLRLCHSRRFYIRAYPRETQEMVFDAHARAFEMLGGVTRRGIYDNMKTAVDAVFTGKERRFNSRFQEMCSHYVIDPVACTPASGWEKGQVENQVGYARDNIFKPRLRFATLEELNGWLEAECERRAHLDRHPEHREKTVWEVYEAERAALRPYAGPFDGFNAGEGHRLGHLLGQLRPQQVLGHGARRPQGCADQGLRRADRGPLRRRGGGRAHPFLRPGPDRLRSLALPAGAGQEARRAQERSPLHRLGAAAGPHPAEAAPGLR